MQFLARENGLDLHLIRDVLPPRKVLEQGVPQSLVDGGLIVRGSLRVETVETQLNRAVDEL